MERFVGSGAGETRDPADGVPVSAEERLAALRDALTILLSDVYVYLDGGTPFGIAGHAEDAKRLLAETGEHDKSAEERLRVAADAVESQHRRGDHTEDGWVGNSIDGLECSACGMWDACWATQLRLAARAVLAAGVSVPTEPGARTVTYPEPDGTTMHYADRRVPTEPGARPAVRHGRHCPCSACAREDWANPDLAPCDYHGVRCAYSPGVPTEPGAPDRGHRAETDDGVPTGWCECGLPFQHKPASQPVRAEPGAPEPNPYHPDDPAHEIEERLRRTVDPRLASQPVPTEPGAPDPLRAAAWEVVRAPIYEQPHTPRSEGGTGFISVEMTHALRVLYETLLGEHIGCQFNHAHKWPECYDEVASRPVPAPEPSARLREAATEAARVLDQVAREHRERLRLGDLIGAKWVELAADGLRAALAATPQDPEA